MRWDEDLLRRLIRAIQAGKGREESAHRLFRIVYPRLFARFRKLGWSREESEDLTQEALLGVFNGIEAFRFESRCESWIFQIAHNTYANFLRSRGAGKRGEQPEESLELVLEKSPGRLGDAAVRPADQLERAIDEERLEKLASLIEAMPDQMRTCFQLRYDQGLKYREIAILMKISVQTVKAHLYQARERLRQQFRLDLGEEPAEPGEESS